MIKKLLPNIEESIAFFIGDDGYEIIEGKNVVELHHYKKWNGKKYLWLRYVGIYQKVKGKTERTASINLEGLK